MQMLEISKRSIRGEPLKYYFIIIKAISFFSKKITMAQILSSQFIILNSIPFVL